MNPEWNESFVVPLENDITKLKIQAMDMERIVSDVLLGEINVYIDKTAKNKKINSKTNKDAVEFEKKHFPHYKYKGNVYM